MTPHLAMPVRNMLYDAMQYGSQVQTAIRAYENEKDQAVKAGREPAVKLPSGSEFLSGLRREDRLIPVITLVIYYSAKPWDGPRTLYDMLNWENGRTRFQPYISDYRINLIEPYGISEEDFSGFRTKLRQILEYVKYSDDKKGLRKVVNQDPAFQNMDRRTVHVINVLTGSRLKYAEEGEAVNMCKAIDDMIQDAVQEKDTVIQEKDTEIRKLQEQMRKIIEYTNLTEEQLSELIQTPVH